MPVSREEVRRIASLARVRLTEMEAEALRHDLNDVLEYVDTLSSVSVNDVPVPDRTPESAPERGPGERQPDSMADPPGRYAPGFRDEFFVVPSPPSLGAEGEPPSPA